MKGEPGALPLMSFALRDLFEVEKTEKGKPMDLTLPEYLRRGGIESALERHANQVFANFSPEQQELARGVFSRLIEVGQGRQDTRRTAVFTELIPAGKDAATVTAIVDALAREGARLLTASSGRDDEAGTPTETTVTIAHEKLIDAWPWLRQLVDENRQAIALQNQIANDAQAWAKDKDAGYLYRGGRLAQVEEKLTELAPNLNDLSQQFVQASLTERQREIEEKEARERQKLEHQRALAETQRQRAEEAEQAAAKQNRLTRIAFAVGGVALLLFFIAGFAGLASINSAEQANASAFLAATNEAHALTSANLAATKEAEALVAQATAISAQATTTAELNRAISESTQNLWAFNWYLIKNRAPGEYGDSNGNRAVNRENYLLTLNGLDLTSDRDMQNDLESLIAMVEEAEAFSQPYYNMVLTEEIRIAFNALVTQITKRAIENGINVNE